MSTTDAIGYVASGLILTTFHMRSMLALRIVAVTSNLACIAYGYLGDLMPILALHALLAPMNVYRVLQLTCIGAGEKTSSA